MVAVEPSYCHQCGTELAEREIQDRNRAVCPACGFRHFRNAVVAVDVIVRNGEDVLLIDPVAGDDWELPGGHPEFDEEPSHAAARELEEETGLAAATADLDLLTVVHTTHEGLHYNMVTYVLEESVTAGRLEPGTEATDLAFWSVDRIFASPDQTRAVDRDALRDAFDR